MLDYCRRISAALIAVIIFPVSSGSFADPIVSRERLEAQIGSERLSLDALVGRPESTGASNARFPVALISHGAPGRESPRNLTLELMTGWVRSLAARGYLAVAVMRRGYGSSDGHSFRDNGTCADPAPLPYLEAHADDLLAALLAVSRRPDADMSRVIGIGHSAGGAAMLALAARSEAGLSAVINVAGGTFRVRSGFEDPFEGCQAYADALAEAMSDLAARSSVPTLWLYAQNDPFFPPKIAERLKTAWTGGGGRAELVILPAYGEQGHRMFIQAAGQKILLPKVDDFLRAHGLPTWDSASMARLRERLTPRQRKRLDEFLSSGVSMKALAVPASGADQSYWITDLYTLAGARTEVREYCEEGSGEACIVIVENFRATGALPARPEQ